MTDFLSEHNGVDSLDLNDKASSINSGRSSSSPAHFLPTGIVCFLVVLKKRKHTLSGDLFLLYLPSGGRLLNNRISM